MAVTVELQNLGDAQLCREITAHIEHALTDRPGEWRVSIGGSRAAHDWDMRIEGPKGFERSYSLNIASGEHQPEAIRKLIVQLIPSSLC
jgi:hypothetical protein